MANEFQKLSGDYQRTGKEAISSVLRSAGDYRKSLEEISFEWAEFSKRSVSQAIEAQAQLTKKAFAAYIGELTKFSMFGLYGPFSRDGSSEGRGAAPTRDRGAATSRRAAASRRKQSNNTKEGSGRAEDCRSTREHAKENGTSKNTENEASNSGACTVTARSVDALKSWRELATVRANVKWWKIKGQGAFDP